MRREITQFVSGLNRRHFSNNRQKALYSLIRLQSDTRDGWVPLSSLRVAHVAPVSLRDLRRTQYEGLDIICRKNQGKIQYRLETQSLQRIQRVFT